MWRILYNSVCFIEKYLAKSRSRASFTNSAGSIEIGPILYQFLTPLMAGAKKKSPTPKKISCFWKFKKSSLPMEELYKDSNPILDKSMVEMIKIQSNLRK